MGNLKKILLILPLVLAGAECALARGRINCGGDIGETLGDLKKLRTDNDKVAQACNDNVGQDINLDTAYKRFPGGDCEQTYMTINYLGDKVENRLREACDAFNQGVSCQGASQQQCLSGPSERFQAAGTKLREALQYLTMARKVLDRRVKANENDVNEYASRGGFDPTQVLGAPPSNLTGESVRYFEMAKEQANAMKHGMQYLEKSKPVEAKLNRYQSQLNSMAAVTGQRGQNIGSTITGSTNPKSLADLVAATNQQPGQGTSGPTLAAAAAAATSQTKGYRPEDFSYEPDPGEVSDDQFFDTLEGNRPLPGTVAAKMPFDAGGKMAETANGAGGEPGKGAGNDSGAGSFTAGSGGLASEGAAGLGGGVGAPRVLASVENSAAKLGAQDLTGASSPLAGGPPGRAKPGDGKENEAFSNYAKGNGNAKLMATGGPSLRDMLKQRLNEGGASTRAMHEVLAGIKDLPGDKAGDSPGGEIAQAEQSSDDDIKGMDSEPLFVRVRAAHLRFQKVHVTDL